MSEAKQPFNLNLDDIDFGHTIRGHQKGDRVFDRFVLQKLLGRGGMGVVWLAFDERLGREVALKFAPEAIRYDEVAVEELKEETRKGLELAHPNIVRIYDFLLDEEYAAISMEFIDGENLGVLRTRQPDKVFEPGQIASWVAQLLDALDYSHRTAKVIHRDLKPANLMIDREGQMRVTDFGIARSISDAMDRATLGRASAGTLAYMSPQQAGGKTPHTSDDIYAFGSTVYELLTGKPPFFTGNIAQQLTDEPATSIAERRREFNIAMAEPVPVEWEQTILACLEKNAEDRPPSAQSVIERLGLAEPLRLAGEPHALPTGAGLTDGPVRVEKAAQSIAPARPRKTGWWKALASVWLLAALVASGWYGHENKALDKLKEWIHPTAPLANMNTPLPVKPAPPAPPAKDRSIQAMINDARSGGTITVPAGVYEEQIQFKKGVNLIAAVPGEVIVQTGGKSGSALRIENCGSGSISGFVFQHTGADVMENATWPVVLMKSSGVTLQNCTVQSGVGDGMLVTGPGRPALQNCVLKNNAGNGLVLESGTTAVVTGCEMRKNGASGMELRHSGTAPELARNTCVDNGDSGIVVKDGADANMKDGNQCRLNPEAGIAAIGDGVSVSISLATCEDNMLGITIQQGAKARINGCTVRHSKQIGIHLDMAAGGCELTDNVVEKSSLNGFMLTGGSGSTAFLNGNKSRQNGLSGIVVAGAGFKPALEHNECDKNGEYGILAGAGCSGVIRNNTCRGNNLKSIGLENAAADLDLKDNITDDSTR